MSIQVALEHRISYRFDRDVGLSPHVVRLRPAPHCRTPVLAYSLTVTPRETLVGLGPAAAGVAIESLGYPRTVDLRRAPLLRGRPDPGRADDHVQTTP